MIPGGFWLHSRTGDSVGSGSGGTTDEIPFPTALHRSGSPEATGMGAGGAVEKPCDGDGERTWGWGRESGDGGAGMGMEERGWGWRSGDGILHGVRGGADGAMRVFCGHRVRKRVSRFKGKKK